MSAASPLYAALCALRDVRAAQAARPEPAFHDCLAELRHWQSAHVAAFHRAHAENYDGRALLDFLTRTFYLEAAWSELARRPARVAKSIGRIIQDDRPLVIAVELQVTADELDGAMADVLLERGQILNASAYVRAFRTVGRRGDRERQIRRIGELVDLLGGYADNRAAYWAFRLTGAPARALGLGQTYALLAEGFSAMRQTQELETATREAVDAQEQMLERLLGGS